MSWGGQQVQIPVGQVTARRLSRAAGQEHRGPHPAALELPLMPQGRAGQRGDGHRCGPPVAMEEGSGPYYPQCSGPYCLDIAAAWLR